MKAVYRGRVNKTLLLPICYFAFSFAAMARLDETIEKCQERYGPILETCDEDRVEKPSKTHKFSKGGIDVLVTICDDRAVVLRFTSGNLDVLMEPTQLTPEQISSFLLRNAESWSTPKKFPPFTSWDSGDGKLFAQYNEASKTLTICKKEFSDAFTNKDGVAPNDF